MKQNEGNQCMQLKGKSKIRTRLEKKIKKNKNLRKNTNLVKTHKAGFEVQNSHPTLRMQRINFKGNPSNTKRWKLSWNIEDP